MLTRDRSKGLAYNLSWAPDGSRLYYDRTDGIYSVPALGGEERLVLENAIAPEALSDGTLIVRRINADRQPQIHRFIPRSVAFLGRPESDASQPPGLYTLDLETKETRHLGASLPIALSSAGLAPSFTVDPDDGSIVLSLRDGTLTRLFRVASNGNVEVLPLLFPTRAIIDAARGTIGAGDSIVVDPDTGDVIAKLNEQGGPRLVRLRSAGGPAHHIPVKGEFGMIPPPSCPGRLETISWCCRCWQRIRGITMPAASTSRPARSRGFEIPR